MVELLGEFANISANISAIPKGDNKITRDKAHGSWRSAIQSGKFE